jgi:hypothetical protein
MIPTVMMLGRRKKKLKFYFMFLVKKLLSLLNLNLDFKAVLNLKLILIKFNDLTLNLKYFNF